MKKLILPVLAAALLLPALPGTAQVPTDPPTGLPTPEASASPSATPTPAPTATTAATGPTQIFAARTATRGVALTVQGQGLLLGTTTTRIASDTTEQCAALACATAAGLAEPLGTTVMAMSPGNPDPEPAEAGNLEPLAQALSGQFGAATASTTDQPSAQAEADGLTIDVTLTQTLVENLPTELTDGLNDALGQIADGLAPIAEGDPTGTIAGVTDTIRGLVGDLGSGPLLRVQGGQTQSMSTIDDAGTLTSTATTAGAIIVLLPTPESTPLLPEGLAVIQIGGSSTVATADGMNPATAEAAGSIGTITLLPGILDALPDIDPGSAEGLPLGDIIELLPEPIRDLLPSEITDLLGGGAGDPTEGPTAAPAPTGTETEGGPTGTPIDDILPTFMQADDETGGFVINLSTGTEQTCVLEDTPLATCVTLGGTSTTFSDDMLGVGVLAAGTDVSVARDATGVGAIEISLARSESGAAADFVTPTPPGTTTPPTATPTPTPQTGTPATGGGSAAMIPALAMLALGGSALYGLRRGGREA